jgi:hypothetical protein
MPQPPLHPMPDHGATDCATDHETYFRGQKWPRVLSTGTGQMHDDRAAGRPSAPLDPRREVIAAGQSVGDGQQR